MRRLGTTLLLVAALAACGSQGDDWQAPPQPHPQGPFVHFATNSLLVPTSATEATRDGLDLDMLGPQRPDNALGNVLATLRGQGIDTGCDADVADGSILLLDSIQAADLHSGDAGWHIYLGDPPAQPPKFDGTDRFDVDRSGPSLTGHGAAYVAGTITNGHFVGGPGSLRVALPFGCDNIVWVDLVGARMQADLTDASCSGKLGGAISKVEVDETVIPALTAAMNTMVAKCPSPHECTGEARTLLELFDIGVACVSNAGCPADATMCMPAGSKMKCTCGLDACGGELTADGVITVEEMLANPLIKALFAPDVDLLDHDGAFQEDPHKRDGVKESMSLGVGFTCVKASYDAPGEP